MSGVSNLVSFGFGAWSGVEFLPTLGFGVGEAVAEIDGKGLHATAVGNQPLYRAARTQARYNAVDNQPRYKVIQ